MWFSYGCALLATQRFEEAAKAFRRCVNLDSDVSTSCIIRRLIDVVINVLNVYLVYC